MKKMLFLTFLNRVLEKNRKKYSIIKEQEKSDGMKIVVTAGGTMGHINPALAIIEEFKKHEKNLEVLYIGTHNRMEKDVIPKKNIPYESIEIYGFTKNIVNDLKDIVLIYKAKKKCKEIFKKFQPDVVIGVGGYVTYPVLKAAKEMHIKTFIHEQNSIPGKANRMVCKYADLIGVTFLESKKYLKTKGKIIYTGHPCGAWALEIPKKDKESLGFTKGKKLVTVVAGSLGSGSLNEKMKAYLQQVGKENYEVCYITGASHFDDFKKETFPSNVLIFPYVEELPGLLKVSDLIVSRAGAGSLSEILALEIPSIIIPSPNVANNHQYYNALELKEKNCIDLLEEKDLSVETLNKEIHKMLTDTTIRLKMIHAMHNEAVQNSALIIYQEIRKLIS